MDEQVTDLQPKQRWWSRLKNRLRRNDTNAAADDLPTADDGMLPGVEDETEQEDNDRGGAMSRWSRRDQAMTRLQEGSDRLAELAASVESHVNAQQSRTDRVVQEIHEMATRIENMAEPVRQQTELIGAISSQIETIQDRAEQLAQALADLPENLAAQTNAIKGIAQQLDISNEANTQMVSSISEMGTSVKSLAQISQAHTDSLRRIENDAERRERALNDALATQTRRTTALLVVAVVIAGLGLLAGAGALFLWLNP